MRVGHALQRCGLPVLMEDPHSWRPSTTREAIAVNKQAIGIQDRAEGTFQRIRIVRSTPLPPRRPPQRRKNLVWDFLSCPNPVVSRRDVWCRMPFYTARVGHWADLLTDDVRKLVGPDADPAELAPYIEAAGREIELLAGQTLVRPCDALSASRGVCRSRSFLGPSPRPWRAVKRSGRSGTPSIRIEPMSSSWETFLSTVRWLGGIPAEERIELFNQAVNPDNHILVPIVATAYRGWWFQVTRRLMWITDAQTDATRLVEPLLGSGEDGIQALVGAEPVLVAARVAQHPADWAISMRIWPSAGRPAGRPWSRIARAIHSHGIPIVTTDPASTPGEIICQVLLLAFWHGYIDAQEHGLVEGVLAAYPSAVDRIKRATSMPDRHSAAALLLEGLLHPGFDPALGAASTRRYVARKASIAIINHKKADTPGLRAWETLGVSERIIRDGRGRSCLSNLSRSTPRENSVPSVDSATDPISPSSWLPDEAGVKGHATSRRGSPARRSWLVL